MEASVAFIAENAVRAKFVHFATHFSVNAFPCGSHQYGRLALTAGKTSGWVSVGMLRRLGFSLFSEIVSISSVVTLSGRMKGNEWHEAIQSLAKSAVQAVLAPVCSLPEESHSWELLKDFYGNLSKYPENRSEALRRAMMEKREKNLNKSPLNWGAFLYYGSTNPFIESLNMAKGSNYYYC